MSRPYDVVLYGATGFTGRLAADWLAKKSDVRWAIAGRNRGKLDGIAAELGDVPVEVASSDDPASLVALASKTRVLASTVGPYARFGDPVVDAAVDGGCDYVDITGEPDFVSGVRDRLDGRARDKGLRLVSCCGFDSLPHDLGVWATVRELPADQPIAISAYVRARGGFSGGTWNSALHGIASRSRKPRGSSRPKPSHAARIVSKFHYCRELRAWGVPLPLIDPIIVVRSARALEYGSSFEYGHYARVKAKRTLVGGALAVGGMVAAAQVPPLRRWLEKRWPSGAGPSDEERAKGWFSVVFLADTPEGRLRTEISGSGDPGYTLTSRWIVEAALCLAQDRDALPDRFGVLTPAAAMAEPLLERVLTSGTRFEVTV